LEAVNCDLEVPFAISFWNIVLHLRNDLYCVGCGVKLYSPPVHSDDIAVNFFFLQLISGLLNESSVGKVVTYIPEY